MMITKIGPWEIPNPQTEDLAGYFRELGLEWIENIPYKQVGNLVLTLDVLRLAKSSSTRSPVILCIHGGAWRKGTNKNYNAVAFALNGYITFNLRYRLTGEAPFPANLEDCMDALGWIEENAQRYGGNPEFIAVRGGSSGAHLALMMGLKAGKRIKAIAAACAPSHLPALYQSTMAANHFFAKKTAETLLCRKESILPLLEAESISNPMSNISNQEKLIELLDEKGFASAFDMLMGYEIGENAAVLEAASPYHLLEEMKPQQCRELPEFLLLHGLADPLVPVYQSLMLRDKMLEKGVSVSLSLFDNAQHDYMFDHGVFCPQRMAILLAFFDRTLRIKRQEEKK